MRLINKIKRLRMAIRWAIACTPLRSQFGYCAENAVFSYPMIIYNPKGLFLYENTKLLQGSTIINTKKEKIIIKKNTEVAANSTFVTNNHVSTVSIPQFLLGQSHINDKSGDIIVEEDCWIRTGVIILAGVHVGRGSIIGAGSIVNKDIPPYAVVAGCPAKIIAAKFSISQIIKHEKALYSENERLSSEYLQSLFDTYYVGKKIYGKSENLDMLAMNTINMVKQELHYVEPTL